MNTLNNGKVLLVDDDTFLVKIYNEKFAAANCAFQSANSVDDALRILRGGFVPDVVIADLELGGKDGFAFLQALKEQHLAGGATIMVLTNHSEESDKAKALELGAEHFIVKAVMIPDEVVQAALSAVAAKNA